MPADLESIEAVALAAMGVVLVAVGARSLARRAPLDRASATAVLLAGAAAVLWKATLFLGYSEDDHSWVEFQETLFFILIALALFLWSTGLLARHARLLAESNDRLVATQKQRERLVQTISHDLAGPLTPIKMQLHVLANTEGIPPQRLAALQRNIDHMERLVSDLRDVALLESGQLRLQPQPVDLAHLLRSAADTMAPVLERDGLHLKTSWPDAIPLRADGQRVAQVLLNLVGNARKFTPSGGTVALTAVATPADVTVRVQDTGRGLDPEEQARLFQAFTQVHEAGESKERGTGLGLYICKTLVEAHGGRMWVESQGKGHGSTFALTLPRAPVQG